MKDWRSGKQYETAMSRFFRDRWPYGSLYVLDIDRIICRPDFSLGLILEEKHVASPEQHWTLTRYIAHELEWWSGLLIYETDTGQAFRGGVTNIDAEFIRPDGHLVRITQLDFAFFDRWILDTFGYHERAVA